MVPERREFDENACVSADGCVRSPVVVLPGVIPKYRVFGNGAQQSPSDYLLGNSFVKYRDPAGVDKVIFQELAKRFVEAAAHIRSTNKNLILTYDGFSVHISFQALMILKENTNQVVALPAHTSHIIHFLYYTVVYPFKTAFKDMLNCRALSGVFNEIMSILHVKL